jgi:2-aminoethylphosphonate-pyruvate transaminase
MSVKQAMLHDWGSRDAKFLAINTRMRSSLVAMIGGEGAFTCVPMQGSGTFAVEAMIGAFVPPAGKLLVLINGAYGKRIAKICEYYKRATAMLEWAEDQPVDPARVAKALADDQAITHVAVVHCETTSGVLNPIAEVARVVAAAGRKLLIDAMSAFGAIALSSKDVPFDAVAASSNKCIEGVPGLGFVLARIDALKQCQGNAPSLSLDLYEQWQALEKTGQYRFTPPIHVIVALGKAIEEHAAEGGVAGRGKRYRENAAVLIDGMRAMGFRTLLPDRLQAPIIVTFHMPNDPRFVFQRFYDALKDRGYVIYPGKLTVADSFRIGCIGRLYPQHMEGALLAVREVLHEMRVSNGGPALAAE